MATMRNRKRRKAKRRFRRRKVCQFCSDATLEIDYKNPKTLRRFISERGRIVPKRISGVCSRHQRSLGAAIRKARVLALVPFTTVHY